MKLSEDWTHKLFFAGLTIAVCSTLLLTFTGLHYRFIFLPEYYGSFANMFWQKPGINFQQVFAYLDTTTGKIFVSLPLCGILLGFAMMSVSTRVSDKIYAQRQKEFVEEWLKENPPGKQTPSQANSRKSARRKARRRF